MTVKTNTYIPNPPHEIGISQAFDIIKIAGIPCAYCGKDMPSNKFLSKVFSSDSQADTQMLQNALKMKYILPKYKQDILNYLSEIQLSQGFTTDNQILNTAKTKAGNEIKENTLKKYDEIVSIIKNSDDTRLKLLMERIGKKYSLMFIKNSNYGALEDFVKKILYNGFFKSTHNETHSKIASVLSDIEKGSEKYLRDYTLKKFINNKARDFYTDLFKETIASVDHVIPKSKGGSDTRDNFLSVCKNCNEQKSNTSLSLFIKNHPKVRENIENQLKLLKKMIPDFILRRKLSTDYLYYTEEINRNLASITDGAIDIVV